MDIAPRLAIFRSGQHQAVDGRTLNFTAADLQQIAAGYDPANDGAPLVVGHPSIDAPAYGWARSLSVEGDTLYAVPDQVDAQFAEMVNAGRFKKISSSVYLPDSPGNPKPGQFYLRHIGFLGAAAPGVKGLKPASFAQGDVQLVEFSAPMPPPMSGLGKRVAGLFRALRAHLASTSGADLAGILPDADIESLETLPDDEAAEAVAFAERATTESTMTDKNAQAAADFAERERQVTEQATQLAAREKVLADRETAARRQDAASFAERLVVDGKLLPREKPAVVEVLLAMQASTEPLSFAEGEATVTKPGGDVLRAFLTGLPKRIEYGRERSADRHDSDAVASFAAPANMQVDNQRLELLAKARAWQAAHPNTTLVDAVRAVGG